VILIGLIAFLGSDTDESFNVTPALEKTQTEPGAFISEDNEVFRKAFMDECSTEPGTYNYCTCAYQVLIDKYTFKEITVMAGKITDENMPEELIDAASMCIDKL
jgi:hypothetical protein